MLHLWLRTGVGGLPAAALHVPTAAKVVLPPFAGANSALVVPCAGRSTLAAASSPPLFSHDKAAHGSQDNLTGLSFLPVLLSPVLLLSPLLLPLLLPVLLLERPVRFSSSATPTGFPPSSPPPLPSLRSPFVRFMMESLSSTRLFTPALPCESELSDRFRAPISVCLPAAASSLVCIRSCSSASVSTRSPVSLLRCVCVCMCVCACVWSLMCAWLLLCACGCGRACLCVCCQELSCSILSLSSLSCRASLSCSFPVLPLFLPLLFFSPFSASSLALTPGCLSVCKTSFRTSLPQSPCTELPSSSPSAASLQLWPLLILLIISVCFSS